MNPLEFLKEQINNAVPSKFDNISKLAEAAQVKQPILSMFLAGKQKSVSFETAWKLLEVIGTDCNGALLKENYEKQIQTLKEEIISLKGEIKALERMIANNNVIMSQYNSQVQNSTNILKK